MVAPVLPSAFQLAPPSVLENRPFCATPTRSMSIVGCDETRPKLPHSDAMPARLPVTFSPLAGGVGETGTIGAPAAPATDPPAATMPPAAAPAAAPAEPPSPSEDKLPAAENPPPAARPPEPATCCAPPRLAS